MTLVRLAMLALALLGTAADARDYLLTGAKPDRLFLIDAGARRIDREYTIPDAAPGQTTIVPSPDGAIAYVIVNHWESIAGIDLDTGEQVFRADLSTPRIRAKAMYAMDVSPDGRELFVFVSPVRLGRGEYEALDTYVAVFDTSHGVGARPIRAWAAPRRISLLAFSADGRRLYSLGADLRAHDPANGEILGTHRLRSWERPGISPPDQLTVWPQFAMTGILSGPYAAIRTDLDPGDPAALLSGVLTLDLASGRFRTVEYASPGPVLFSTVVNPARREEAFGVYNTLSRIDLERGVERARIELDHTYYSINVSRDGSEIYLGGALGDIAIYSTHDLARLGTIGIPGGANMSMASLRMITR